MARNSASRREPLSDRSLEDPHPDRLPLDHPHRKEALKRHRQAMSDGSPGYIDPGTGLFVLTAKSHATRGHCCGNGCRHCPYL
ncbi:MAG: hypothetical protein CMH41_09890 [Micrococcales bacterium]|nr:hypothetical protein [Micrococcales bacterium]